MSASEIPLRPTPQKLSVTLSSVTYVLTVRWNWVEACWVMDVDDVNGNPIAHGLAMVTGTDLFGQLSHLGFEGMAVAQTDHNTDAVPTFSNLGSTGHLYYVTP